MTLICSGSHALVNISPFSGASNEQMGTIVHILTTEYLTDSQCIKFQTTVCVCIKCRYDTSKVDILVTRAKTPNKTERLKGCTVVPVMNGYPRDQAKVSVHCRWPLIRGTDGHVEMSRDIDNVAVHSRWPLTTGVAQGRYYCISKSIQSCNLEFSMT